MPILKPEQKQTKKENKRNKDQEIIMSRNRNRLIVFFAIQNFSNKSFHFKLCKSVFMEQTLILEVQEQSLQSNVL
jgi:hypothetical protein